MFNWIWENRPHLSEVSGKPLLPKGHFKWHWQFAHILPKGTYSRFKLREDNIMLMLPEEHDKQETFDLYLERKQEMRDLYKEEHEQFTYRKNAE